MLKYSQKKEDSVKNTKKQIVSILFHARFVPRQRRRAGAKQRKVTKMKRILTETAKTLAGAATLLLGGWAGLWIITGIMRLLNI